MYKMGMPNEKAIPIDKIAGGARKQVKMPRLANTDVTHTLTPLGAQEADTTHPS